MTSPEKAESNRRNSRKSTGPRTPEGKARVARNAVTHGLTAEPENSPGDPPEAYRRELAAWVGGLNWAEAAERGLAERACRALWGLRRCDRFEDATAARRDRDAAEVHDLAEAARAEATGRRLLTMPGSAGAGRDIETAVRDARPGGGGPPVEEGPGPPGFARPGDDDPAGLVAELRRTAAGVAWLMARWADLGRALKGPGGWDDARKFAAVRLLGLRPEEADAHPLIGRATPRPIDLAEALGGRSPFDHPAMQGALDAAADAEKHGLGTTKALWYGYLATVIEREQAASGAGPSGAELAALVRREREKLGRRMRRVLKARAAADRAGAADRSMFDDPKSLSLCLRYATAASRDLHRSIRVLIKLREEGVGEDRDDGSGPPAPRPVGGDDAPGPGANPSPCEPPNLRNKATVAPAATVPPKLASDAPSRDAAKRSGSQGAVPTPASRNTGPTPWNRERRSPSCKPVKLRNKANLAPPEPAPAGVIWMAGSPWGRSSGKPRGTGSFLDRFPCPRQPRIPPNSRFLPPFFDLPPLPPHLNRSSVSAFTIARFSSNASIGPCTL